MRKKGALREWNETRVKSCVGNGNSVASSVFFSPPLKIYPARQFSLKKNDHSLWVPSGDKVQIQTGGGNGS